MKIEERRRARTESGGFQVQRKEEEEIATQQEGNTAGETGGQAETCKIAMVSHHLFYFT